MERSMFDLLFSKDYKRDEMDEEAPLNDGETCEQFYKRVGRKETPDTMH